MKDSKFNLMGVINITPDSFSDGGDNFDGQSILKNCQKMAYEGAAVFDFGAESTAPFNSAITAEQELERFKENLFPVLENVLKLNLSISIDTYKPEVFAFMAEKLYGFNPNLKLFWNDVSGIIDNEMGRVLKNFPQCHYVFSHNKAPSREETSDHMNFVEVEIDILREVNEFFKEGLLRLDHQNIILDPCFGFSKSFEQNWSLIKRLPELISAFNHPWLLGISRKSFLRKAIKDNFPAVGDSYSEYLHLMVLEDWVKRLPQGSYFIRLHDCALGHIGLSGQQILT